MTQTWSPHAGGWRLHILHETGFTYDGEARASHNEARLTPSNLPTQSVLATELRVRPTAGRSSYRDYWGNRVVAFQLDEPHATLQVTSESTVETSAARPPLGLLSRAELSHGPVADLMDELLEATAMTALPAALMDATREATAELDAHEAADYVSAHARELLAYVPGVTEVHTTANEALEVGKGVCQDFTHLSLGLLRGIGIPARYVSGYLYPRDGVEPGETTQGESHAWLDYFAGEWNALDPTSGAEVGPRHVVVARGRDYIDAAPLKGIYHGAPVSALGVSVAMTRLT
jgi:transglutaminase-like putative cysteine protease